MCEAQIHDVDVEQGGFVTRTTTATAAAAAVLPPPKPPKLYQRQQ